MIYQTVISTTRGQGLWLHIVPYVSVPWTCFEPDPTFYNVRIWSKIFLVQKMCILTLVPLVKHICLILTKMHVIFLNLLFKTECKDPCMVISVRIRLWPKLFPADRIQVRIHIIVYAEVDYLLKFIYKKRALHSDFWKQNQMHFNRDVFWDKQEITCWTSQTASF